MPGQILGRLFATKAAATPSACWAATQVHLQKGNRWPRDTLASTQISPPHAMPHLPPDEHHPRTRLLFALTAERLSAYYEHGVWITDAQTVQLTSLWQTQTRIALSVKEKRAIAELSDAFAHELAASVSREAGLFISHELTQAQDPDYQSAIGIDVLNECDAKLREAGLICVNDTL